MSNPLQNVNPHQIEPYGGLYTDTNGETAVAWGLRFGYLFAEKKEPDSLNLDDAGWHVGLENEVIELAPSKVVAIGGYQSALLGLFNYELGIKAGGRSHGDTVKPGGEIFAGTGFYPNRTFFVEFSAGHYLGTNTAAEFRTTAGINVCGLVELFK